jgi:dienelactone hydrolase
MRFLWALALAAGLLAAGQGAATPLPPGVTAREVTFNSDGRKVTGELISGTSKAPHPAVLFVHWLGEPKTTNHTEFEKDAIALARRGVTSLLIDAMWSDPAWFDKVGVSAEADLKQAAGQVADIRKALDLLEAQRGVDKARIALVGHDFGAMFGALAAAEDPRPRVLVLMAGVPTMSEWYLLGKTHPDKAGYVKAMSALDTPPALARSKARAVLFQFAAHDKYIPAERAALFSDTKILPRGVFTYDADHSLDVPQAFADRQAWLVEQLLGR